MARSDRFEPLYKAFDMFLNRCILDNRSLLWPNDTVWTLENVTEVKGRVVDNPMPDPELSFEEKLQQQLQGVAPELWRIVADIYYVYSLPSNFIKFKTKHEYAKWAAQQGGYTVPVPEAEIWEAQRHGFTRTSLHYHYKYAQFWLIILLAQRLKSSPNPEEILENPSQLQQLLDSILKSVPDKNDRAYDMRHAILYLTHPNDYERIISTRDKKRIVSAFRDKIKDPPPKNLDSLQDLADLDDAIRRIREALTPRYSQGFDFYDSDIRHKWRPDGRGGNGNGEDDDDTPCIKEDLETYIQEEISDSASGEVRRVLSALCNTHNLILYGPPGTGKTYIARETARALVRSDANASDDFVVTTFHQSYTYEDFVEGLRPVLREDEGLAYEIVPGVFKRIADKAADDPNNKYILVIDEINRGNITKILGELITLLEDDKRKGEEHELAVTLPHSMERFTVPDNLYIIGTMNTADRSIALLDVALRRRFAFLEVMPRPELLTGVTVESTEGVVNLEKLLHTLNGDIRRYLDRDHQIGHSYFLKIKDAPEEDRVKILEFVWNHKLLPLLQEYFYNQPDRLIELLAPFVNELEMEDQDEIVKRGVEIGRETGDDLLRALDLLAER